MPTTASRWRRPLKARLGKVGDMLQRMRELAVQAANGTNSDSDRVSLNQEFIQLSQEATRTLSGTQFNGQSVLSTTSDAMFQIGANSSSDVDRLTVTAFSWSANTSINSILGTTVISGTEVPVVQITDTPAAQSAISSIDAAIDAINGQRANFGAVQNRFENIVANMQVAVENQSAAKSRIMDADYAAETAALSRANILQQAGNAMVAQANQLPQQVLALLKG